MSYRDDIVATRTALHDMYRDLCDEAGQALDVPEAMKRGLEALDRLASGNAALWADILESGRYDVRATRREEPRQPLPYISAGYAPPPQQAIGESK